MPEGEGKYRPPGAETGKAPEKAQESRLRVSGLDTGKSPEKADYFLGQLGTETVDKLLNLDLANKPEAQEPLLEFLAAMGIGSKRIKESNVARQMAEAAAYKNMSQKNVKEKPEIDIIEGMH
ncbi:hypothetical protein A3B21_02025 [Candidatus Uhrbacteria bacterium RIFCSPLOWO2_01_FULL_47_24]|uniref:Uncharacterized protein n=1 Tax=Candidatus Uhrbacteria bacterium RIFCSPLOWO2_01_FULL_47_24 TaxID=1802401 RepID=A0A1F7UPD5_9BACT|nr:MAG: hypothetical protein A2753_01775 [Candidatus Uhrbacteria bacterium RIFCSPHIGHO2_01_FULL_47_11]OGL67946.1 MAG: hypothetical protein A3D58_05220 [Candidatus Uhrbacteria bacterium RIFCSPHIGHO2_02_FULL_46_47]OGL76435.1 MAG: hypothetical protein A3F52_02860 [Candidatus Uhrbacteria bacterium RIFCSPHIGHO2_12_FULL_47_11]OGL80132.1 MAG: hypothetical protein A3B21_02025 [Candidatus Uhrbacteria bacterium RIFCSPLOWO2_01_FULL_47_24]OGL84917.1 MAG: hypothetical protein A3J03_04405 [Candidatus Uhrbact